uniref:Putative reverse transcriptase, intron maturase and HNH endonuclease n=1 Tax=Chlamydomonas applanata TaxID=35704 RepID=A0A0S2LPB2_CHLAP|nr:putative reverse transcriptase, intron maturase and HNH endonuclease [Chlamydomonas applanata]
MPTSIAEYRVIKANVAMNKSTTQRTTSSKFKSLEWKRIKWKPIMVAVQKWQQRIYSASKVGNLKEVRRVQRTLLNSYSARLLAVRKVTQDNRGKKTAGVDGKKSLSPTQRLVLTRELKLGIKASPIRRVWIPKPGRVEKRLKRIDEVDSLLGIPTIKDRALQALVKLALEPEWEAKFEADNYGFRPGRGAHDAMKSVLNNLQKKAKFVLDADISKCFDRINHEALLNKLNLKGLMRWQIKQWLKAGILDNLVLTNPEMGTPQGGIISPLLANIALHGLEERLRAYAINQPMFYPGGAAMSKDRRADSISYIRYADDFVIMHDRLDILLACKEITIQFLAEMGLELSPTKTRITHTLDVSEELKQQFGVEKPGFKFLGFEIRHIATKYRSDFVQNKPLGYRIQILPTVEKQLAHSRQIGKIIRKNSNLSQEALIKILNPIIRGWRNYFGVSSALQFGVFQKLDHLLFLKLKSWARKRKNTKALWKTVDGDNWMFSPPGSSVSLEKYSTHHISIFDYKKNREDKNPFDGDYLYWAKRTGRSPLLTSTQTKLLAKQQYKCKFCDLLFNSDDLLEIDHIIPRSQGGPNRIDNLQILHRHCHDVKSTTDPKKLSMTGALLSE